MKRFGFILAALAALVYVTASARADILTYTETTTASGSLDGSSFSNALVTLTLTGNTADITGSSPIFNLDGTTTVSVAGTGSDTFTFQSQVTVNQGLGGVTGAGIGDETSDLTILFTHNSGFSSYGLSTPIGPLSGAAGDNLNFDFATIGGSFDLTSIGVPGAVAMTTFTAAEATTVPTPEPGSLLLLATVAAGLVAMLRMRNHAL